MAITPIINTTTIKNNIAAFIQAVTGQSGQGKPVTWAFEWQPAPKPLKPYAVYKITGPRKVGGLDEIRAVQLIQNGVYQFDNEGNPIFGEYDKSGEREYTVAIECGSDDETATILATNLETALEQPQFISILEQNGYAVRGIIGIQDVTALLADSPKYERRVILEFYFVATSQALYGSSPITRVTGENEVFPSQSQPLETTLDTKGPVV